MLNLLNKNQTEELVNAIKGYQGQSIIICSLIKDESNSYRSQVFDNVDIDVNNIGIGIENSCEDDGNIIEFIFDKIEDTYIDIIDKEIHVVFNYMGMKYSMLNLV